MYVAGSGSLIYYVFEIISAWFMFAYENIYLFEIIQVNDYPEQIYKMPHEHINCPYKCIDVHVR